MNRSKRIGNISPKPSLVEGHRSAQTAVHGLLRQHKPLTSPPSYIAPVGGGKATIGETTVRTSSPSSPLGEAMVELEVGDAFELDSPRGLLAFEVSAIG